MRAITYIWAWPKTCLGFLILFTALLGRFFLRRRLRREGAPSPPTTEDTKTDVAYSTLPVAEQPERPAPITSPIPAPKAEPLSILDLDPEVRQHYDFISQLPPPTLGFAGAQDCFGGEKQRRVFRMPDQSGRARTVLEEEHVGAGGQRWKRRMMVFTPMPPDAGTTATTRATTW